MYVSMRDTCTICGADVVAIYAVTDLVFVLGETFIIFCRSVFDSANFSSGFTCRSFCLIDVC